MPLVNLCKFCIFGKREKTRKVAYKNKLQSWEVWGRGAAQHLPVKHVAQGLVPDPRVHRGACLPCNQIGCIVEKMDVHQVKGAVGQREDT